MLWLAAAAAANGVLQPPPLFPDWGNLGSTPLLAAVGIAVVVPVLLNCDVCHQSLHPLMPLLQVSCLVPSCSTVATQNVVTVLRGRKEGTQGLLGLQYCRMAAVASGMAVNMHVREQYPKASICSIAQLHICSYGSNQCACHPRLTD